MKKLIALGVCWAIAMLLFWAIFFKLTPIITNAIPSGEWQGLLKILTYVIVGYVGGVGLPLFFIIVGAYIAFTDL